MVLDEPALAFTGSYSSGSQVIKQSNVHGSTNSYRGEKTLALPCMQSARERNMHHTVTLSVTITKWQ